MPKGNKKKGRDGHESFEGVPVSADEITSAVLGCFEEGSGDVEGVNRLYASAGLAPLGDGASKAAVSQRRL